MRKLFFILFFYFISINSFADKVSLFIDYDGVWAPIISVNNERSQLCAASTDANYHKRVQISDFCKLQFGNVSSDFSFNHQADSHVYLYADKTSNKVIADLYSENEEECNYSIFLKEDGILSINKSSDSCKYKVYARVEKDQSLLKLYSSPSVVSID